ncbi:MAG: CapA family protein [Bacteroidia bacterium]|nr:CapA family protein [Bacteroidia bacterium]
MEKRKRESLKILFGGDTGFGEFWHLRNEREGKTNLLKKKGYPYFLEKIKGFIARHDYKILNLETALVSEDAVSPFADKKPYLNPGHDQLTPQHLSSLGIDAVSLANNHAFDFGETCLDHTLKVLENRRIEGFGIGKNLADAASPLHWKHGKLSLYVLGCYWFVRQMEKNYQYYALPDRPGVYAIESERIRAQISEIRLREPHACIVVYPHWGKNYHLCNQVQRDLGHHMIDAGADIVVGHGAHQLQEIELYRGKWIIYSLGNFIYGAPGRYRQMNGIPYSLALQMRINSRSGKIAGLNLYPLLCNNRKTKYQTRLVEKDEIPMILPELLRNFPPDLPPQSVISLRSNRHGAYLKLNTRVSGN